MKVYKAYFSAVAILMFKFWVVRVVFLMAKIFVTSFL